MSSVVQVHSDGTITESGSVVITGYFDEFVTLIVNVTDTPTGTSPSITFTVQEVDPGNNLTTFGDSGEIGPLSSAGVASAVLHRTASPTLKVSWVVSGTSPSFTGVYATLVGKDSSYSSLGVKETGNTTFRQLAGKFDENESEYRLLVDAKAQLTPPVPPPSTTPRTIVPSGTTSVVGNTTDSYEYTIPNGATLTIQQIVAGAEGDPNERGSKVTLYYVDSGSVAHVVQRIYLQSTSMQVTPETSQAVDGTSMVGNGSTTKLRIDRTRLGGGNAEIDVVVRGYES